MYKDMGIEQVVGIQKEGDSDLDGCKFRPTDVPGAIPTGSPIGGQPEEIELALDDNSNPKGGRGVAI